MKKLIVITLLFLFALGVNAQSGFMMDLGDGVYFWRTWQNQARSAYVSEEADKPSYTDMENIILGESSYLEYLVREMVLKCIMTDSESNFDRFMRSRGFTIKSQKDNMCNYYTDDRNKSFSYGVIEGKYEGTKLSIPTFFFTTNDSTDLENMFKSLENDYEDVINMRPSAKDNFYIKALSKFASEDSPIYYLGFKNRSTAYYFTNKDNESITFAFMDYDY